MKYCKYGTAFFQLCFLFLICGCALQSEMKETAATEMTETEDREDMEDIEDIEMIPESETIAESMFSEAQQLIVEIDPGHGGKQSGAERRSAGVIEKDLNLQIAFYLKEELESYDNVTVFLTRYDDSHVELEDRVRKAAEDQADILISIHNNGKGDIAAYDHGCTILVPRGVYEPELSLISQEVACCILKELEKIGLANQGLMFRVCQNEETYPNGEYVDYYSIIRNSMLYGIPGILIEHAFLDSDADYEQFLSDDSKIRKLAKADARGLASYYQLEKEGIKEQEAPEPYEAFITLITTDSYKDNKYFWQSYFR